MFPRTFTLARVLLGVTALCIVCGLAVSAPLNSLFGALDAAVFGLVVVLIMLLRRPRIRKHSPIAADERLDQQREIHRLFRRDIANPNVENQMSKE